MYDGDDLPDTYVILKIPQSIVQISIQVKIIVNQAMKPTKTKKTSVVRRSIAPAYNQVYLLYNTNM